MAAKVIDLSSDDVDIIVNRGDAWFLDFHVPLDLTGATVECQLRETADSPDVLANFTVDVTDAPGGLFTLSQAVATLTGVWDVQITIGGKPRTYTGGKFKLKKDVTKPVTPAP